MGAKRRWGIGVLLLLLLVACGHGVKVGKVGADPGSLVSSDAPTVDPSVSPSDSPTSTESSASVYRADTPTNGFGGRITDGSGRPLQGMCVSLVRVQIFTFAREDEQLRSDNDHPIVAHSASDGTYVVSHAWPKSYSSGPNEPYHYGGWQVEYWDCSSSPQYGPRMIVITPVGVVDGPETPVAPSSTTTGFAAGIDVRLPPGGTITGLLVDEHGTPAVGVCVGAYDGVHYDGLYAVYYADYTVRTNQAGRFIISGLSNATGGDASASRSPVSYRLLAGDCSDSAYNPQWYRTYLVPPEDCCTPALPSGSYAYDYAEPIIVHSGETTNIGTMVMHPPLPKPSPTPTPSDSVIPSESPTDSPSPSPSTS